MTSDTLSMVYSDDPEAAARVGPCLFLLFECGRPLAGSTRHDLRDLDEVMIGRMPDRHHAREHRQDGARVLTLGIPDPRMSQRHARLAFSLDRWILEDADSKNGVVLNGTRQQRAILGDGDLFDLGHSIFLFCDPTDSDDLGYDSTAHDDLELDRDSAELRAPLPVLATFVTGLRRVFDDLARVAPTRTPVLLLGETGTGKEVVARAVHALSGRPGPFVPVNCGALPATLVESELFGYRKGAFSGANEDRDGLVRSANGGTLFLDEIGDLPLPSQVTLLRVLQEGEVMPVGATKPIAVDLKLVAATHHDLEALVAADKFRRDLYGRIKSFVVCLPPLRERREDLGLLVASILGRITRTPPPFSIEAGRALMRHDWPLNVRELDHALTNALTLVRGGAIELAHLPEDVRQVRPAPAPSPSPPRVADADRKAWLESLLREHEGNISAVARAAGLSRPQIHRLIRRYGLDLSRYRRRRDDPD